jgi:phosphatidylglycerophosphate synthase
MHPGAILAKPPRPTTVVEEVDIWLRLGFHSEHLPLLADGLVKKQIVLVQSDRHVERFLRRAYPGDVVDVRVREEDVFHREPVAIDRGEQFADLVARIDDDGLACILAADNKAVFEERWGSGDLENGAVSHLTGHFRIPGQMANTPYTEAKRVHDSFLAGVEKRCLIWMAKRLPAAINSDHLTVLAGVAMFGAGLCYWNGSPAALLLSIVLLAVNWFGDSLDGTLARVRHHERPRYGFYVDHVLDALCILFIFAGLILGNHISVAIGGGFSLAYYLLTIEIALATHAVGVFRISFWKFGPTELRILLALGSFRLMHSDFVRIAGSDYRLFDIGGAIGIVALAVTFIVAAVRNAHTLYRAEPLPERSTDNSMPIRSLCAHLPK